MAVTPACEQIPRTSIKSLPGLRRNQRLAWTTLEAAFSPERPRGGHSHAKLRSISCISHTHTHAHAHAHAHTHTQLPLFNIRILLCIMNRSPIILSNYRDSDLFQTAVLGQVKWRQFKQIDLRIPLKTKKKKQKKKKREQVTEVEFTASR